MGLIINVLAFSGHCLKLINIAWRAPMLFQRCALVAIMGNSLGIGKHSSITTLYILFKKWMGVK